jgi:hypothetical protein
MIKNRMSSKLTAVFTTALFMLTICISNGYTQKTYVFQQELNGYQGTVNSMVNPGIYAQYPIDLTDTFYNEMLIDGGGENDTFHTLLRFEDIIGDGVNQIPVGSTVLSAKIDVWVVNGGDTATVYDLLVAFDRKNGNAFQAWGDDVNPVADTHYDSSSAIEFVNRVDYIGTIDVTESLKKWVVQERENYGWLMLNGGSDGVEFRSWQSGLESYVDTSPYLVVETSAGTYRFQEGVDGYEGVVDTWVEEQETTRDVGRRHSMLADGGVDDGTWALMRFDDLIGDQPGQIPLGTEIHSAELVISIWNKGNTTFVYDLKPGHSFNDLSAQEAADAGIDPTNFETFGNPEANPSDYIDRDTIIDTIPSRQQGQFHIDVTSSLQRYSAGEENTGWFFLHVGGFGEPDPLLGGVADDGVEWRASEFGVGTIPTLVVETPNGSYTFQDGLNGYEGTVDTQINSGNNWELKMGQKIELSVNGENAQGEDTVLIKFEDIIGSGENQIPQGTSITSAKLILSIVDEGEACDVYDILPPHTFDEDTTYSTFSADPIGGEGLSTEPIGKTPGQDSFGSFEIDVTASVQRYSDGQQNTGWIFITDFFGEDPSDGIGFDSSESRAVIPPTLTVVIEGPAAVENYSIY